MKCVGRVRKEIGDSGVPRAEIRGIETKGDRRRGRVKKSNEQTKWVGGRKGLE